MHFPASMRWMAALLGTLVTLSANAQETAPPKAEAPTAALKSLAVYPDQIQLDGPRDEQRLGVVGAYADGRSWDLSRSAQYASSDPKVSRRSASRAMFTTPRGTSGFRGACASSPAAR